MCSLSNDFFNHGHSYLEVLKSQKLHESKNAHSTFIQTYGERNNIRLLEARLDTK